MASDQQMHRVRFWVTGGDPRPVVWPPPGPFWCTGYRDSDEACVVAYVPSLEDVTALWPDAVEVDDMGVQPVTFSGRFQRPSWWEVSDAE